MQETPVPEANPDRPLVIGIAGGTGSGKSTVAHKLATSIPSERCVVIDHDSYYFDQGHLSPEARSEINYDHPASLESRLLAEHLRLLRNGASVEIPIYDFVTHTRRVETRTFHVVNDLGWSVDVGAAGDEHLHHIKTIL